MRIHTSRGMPELIALVIFVPLAVVLGTLLWRSSVIPTASPEAATSPAVSVAPHSLAPEPAGGQEETAEPQESTAATITLEIKAPARTDTYRLPLATQEKSSVARLLQTAVDTQGLQMETTDYGGSLGLFITSMNGVANDPSTGMYWHLYINNELSPVGASSAQVSSNDRLKWVYEKEHEEE